MEHVSNYFLILLLFLPANYLLCDPFTAASQRSRVKGVSRGFILCFWWRAAIFQQRAPIESEHNFVIPTPFVHGSGAVNAKEEPLRLGNSSPNPHSPLMPSGLLWVWIKFGCRVPSLTEPPSPPPATHTHKLNCTQCSWWRQQFCTILNRADS